MFKKDNLETPLDKINTLIGDDTFFKGTINGKGSIRIDGDVEGSLDNKGDVVVGEKGRLKADLKGRNITIAGNYEGALEAGGRLELRKTAVALGTFKANTLLIEDGAILNGSVDTKHKETISKDDTNQGLSEKPPASGV